MCDYFRKTKRSRHGATLLHNSSHAIPAGTGAFIILLDISSSSSSNFTIIVLCREEAGAGSLRALVRDGARSRSAKVKNIPGRPAVKLDVRGLKVLAVMDCVEIFVRVGNLGEEEPVKEGTGVAVTVARKQT